VNSDRPPFRRTVAVIIVVATLVGFVSVFAVWAKRQLLETSTYTETSTELLQNDAIRTAVAGFLVDELYSNVNVSGELSRVLPPRAAPSRSTWEPRWTRWATRPGWTSPGRCRPTWAS
jgi:hypothetical protein